MTVTVFTAMMGEDTDQVRAPLVVDPGVRYLCFSDQPCHVPPYQLIRVPSSVTPRLTSRRIKILADHPALQMADVTLWHDASYQLRRGLRWVTHGLNVADILALPHPSRASIEDEAVKIVRYGYLSPAAADAHLARYRAAGYDALGVTCAGLLARRVSAPMAAFNRAWWTEVLAWGGRDQASLGYTAWRHRMRLRHLQGTIKENRYANWRVLTEAVLA